MNMRLLGEHPAATLPGPAREITVEPIQVPEEEPRPLKLPDPEPAPAPQREPEREPEKVPA
jgi:NADH-quinone oxidoreductase subunit C